MRAQLTWLVVIGMGVFCGCSSVKNPTATSHLANAQTIALRNNSASLLYDLLGDEKNVSKILLIKRNNAELGYLIKSISEASKDASKQLEQLAKSDPTLNLQALILPAGEVAARKAIAKTKEHELLSSSGENFQFQLLLTQADALSYGWHLAAIASDNSSSPESAHIFKAISINYEGLYIQVVGLLKNGTQEAK